MIKSLMLIVVASLLVVVSLLTACGDKEPYNPVYDKHCIYGHTYFKYYHNMVTVYGEDDKPVKCEKK